MMYQERDSPDERTTNYVFSYHLPLFAVKSKKTTRALSYSGWEDAGEALGDVPGEVCEEGGIHAGFIARS